MPNRIRASVATRLQNLRELEWFGMDERGAFAEITMDVVSARQIDVPALVELPGWEFRHLRDLCDREQEVGQSCGAATATGERMNPDDLRMDGDAELARCPIFGGLPTVWDPTAIRSGATPMFSSRLRNTPAHAQMSL